MNEQNTYDEVPYPDLAFQRTPPNRTAAMAALFGLAPAHPQHARILELGCAAGGNLLPMGVELPDAELLGIDLSAKQIEAGEAVRREAGISNVTLRQANLLDLDASLGRFDYIIAHGVFSWVPAAVQDKLLDICRDNLAPNGVAYVSYNCYPGWHFRGALRDMMLYHVAGFPDPATRILQARALLDFLVAQGSAGPYADMLKAEAEAIRGEPDGYFYHEYLELNNHPIHFHEFVRRAHAKNLHYLGETRLAVTNDSSLKAEAANVLERISGNDPVRRGQYLDFLRNRSFRESLLVHGGQTIGRRPDWQPIRQCWVSSSLKPEHPAFDPGSPEPAVFVSAAGIQIRLSDPLAKTAQAILLENHPRPLAFSLLVEAARERLKSSRPQEQDETNMGKFILEAYGYGIMDVLAHPWPCASTIGDKPRTSPLARVQARAGRSVVNLAHQHLDNLSADVLELIGLLDGERTVDEAIDALFRRVDPERIKAQAGEPARMREGFSDSMRGLVANLRDSGMLL